MFRCFTIGGHGWLHIAGEGPNVEKMHIGCFNEQLTKIIVKVV